MRETVNRSAFKPNVRFPLKTRLCWALSSHKPAIILLGAFTVWLFLGINWGVCAGAIILAAWIATAMSHGFEERAYDPRGGLLYLAIPALIFLASFITPPIGWGVGCFIVISMIVIFATENKVRHTHKALLAAALLALLVLWIVGFPNGPYVCDWFKHWAILNELASHDWPLHLTLQDKEQYFRFYMGAYLPAALIHKSFPSVTVVAAFGAWLFLGYVLVFLSASVVTKTRKQAWAASALLLLMGGAGMFGAHFYRALNRLPDGPWLGLHYDTWVANASNIPPLEFSSVISTLAWVPHQSIATYIVTCLLILRRSRGALEAAMLGFGLLALGSPYGMIGLFPLMLLLTWERRTDLMQAKTLLCTLAGASFALVVLANLSVGLPSVGPCFDCVVDRFNGRLSDFLPFWFVQLIPFVLILRVRLVRDTACLISVLTVVLISLMYGAVPDFVMRGTMGPLFVLYLRSVEVLAQWEKATPWQRALQILAVSLCLTTAVNEAIYQREAGAAYNAFASNDPLGAKWLGSFAMRDDYTAQQFFDESGWKYLKQYFSTEKPPLSP